MSSTTPRPLHIAIDGNEANVTNRVGSNVYAYEVLVALEELVREDESTTVTVLLAESPIHDLPATHDRWQYRVVGPKPLWTQFGLPLHLYFHQFQYDVFFTPGHYAPRLSPVPYVSSVMDLAFLYYPDQFQKSDLVQLKHWTAYSVRRAKKVIAISEATKADVIKQYRRKPNDVVVAYPALPTPATDASDAEANLFFHQHQLRKPYILFMGTFQPRKNLVKLVEAYEQLCRSWSAQTVKRKSRRSTRGSDKPVLPQLVLAGKIGWLADDIVARIKRSPFFDYIITPGFVPDSLKSALYQRAACSVLVGLYEGFGIPPLESLHYRCLPVVSNTTSLPEVVGEAGILVDPRSPKSIAEGLEQALTLTAKEKALYQKHARQQVKQFNWRKSAETILDTLKTVAVQR